MNVFGLTFAALCKREALCGTKPSATTSTKHKRADLQGLRGIAILFVLVMHLKPNSYRLGFVGVDIFFVLSGFLMAKILLERKLTLWTVWSFYNRRFKRIVPLYMLFVVSVYICKLKMLLDYLATIPSLPTKHLSQFTFVDC
ncbi:unnamed protein product [Cylicostephanus goldi]|uniref:Acyltransferase 3 domain-containing protein n=1 Tax=Cylicostephanus goldi TaxID=71465 RepID=A0A3P7QWA7_CYLGO|nr:unnamed protein product [Cylicostephanus goldi]